MSKHREATYVYSFPKSDRLNKSIKVLSKNSKRIDIKSNTIEFPGPGAYDPIKVSLNTMPIYKIGTEKRDFSYLKNKNPGVGEYKINSTIGENVPKITISKKFTSKSKKLIKVNNPGPGEYNPNIDVVVTKEPSYKIRPKTSLDPSQLIKLQKIKRIVTPGPGYYDCDKDNNVNTAFKFGSEKKFKTMKFTSENTPGYYNVPSELSISTSMKVGINRPHTSSRKVNHIKNNPGPGYYFEKETGNQNEKYSIGVRRPFTSIDRMHKTFPGPGKYHDNISFKPTNVSTKFGKDTRKGLELKFCINNPTLNKYNPDYSVIKEKHSSYSIGKSIRSSNKIPLTPGVGNYDIEGVLGNYGPKYSIKHEHLNKSKIKVSDLTPGPFEYDNQKTQILYKASSWKFGKTKKLVNPISSDNPGPGEYNPSLLKSNKSVTIGKDKRKNYNTNNNPGPGFYKIPYSLFDFPGFVSCGGFDTKFKYI